MRADVRVFSEYSAIASVWVPDRGCSFDYRDVPRLADQTGICSGPWDAAGLAKTLTCSYGDALYEPFEGLHRAHLTEWSTTNT